MFVHIKLQPACLLFAPVPAEGSCKWATAQDAWRKSCHTSNGMFVVACNTSCNQLPWGIHTGVLRGCFFNNTGTRGAFLLGLSGTCDGVFVSSLLLTSNIKAFLWPPSKGEHAPKQVGTPPLTRKLPVQMYRRANGRWHNQLEW